MPILENRKPQKLHAPVVQMFGTRAEPGQLEGRGLVDVHNPGRSRNRRGLIACRALMGIMTLYLVWVFRVSPGQKERMSRSRGRKTSGFPSEVQEYNNSQSSSHFTRACLAHHWLLVGGSIPPAPAILLSPPLSLNPRRLLPLRYRTIHASRAFTHPRIDARYHTFRSNHLPTH